MGKKIVEVVGAVIVGKESGKWRVLAFRRKRGKAAAGMWEFPGGKVEPGESHRVALTRELKEELDVTATVGDLVVRSQTEVGDSVIDLSCYWVSLSAVPAASADHDKIEWMALSSIVYADWAVPDHRALDALPLLLAEERSGRG